MDLTRRGFLRLMAACAATVAMPVPQFVLAEPMVVIPSMPVALGGIRVLSQFDIRNDRFIVRLDACNGKDQFGVDFWVAGSGDIRKDYLEHRAVAEQVLRESMLHEGWLASDMIALPLPLGYKEPDWMRA